MGPTLTRLSVVETYPGALPDEDAAVLFVLRKAHVV